MGRRRDNGCNEHASLNLTARPVSGKRYRDDHRDRGDHRLPSHLTNDNGVCRNDLWAKGRTPAGNKRLDRPTSPTWTCDGRKGNR